MRLFDYEKLSKQTWDNEIVSYIAQIHEYKGRQELFVRQKPIVLERLTQIAQIQSTEASNRIEGIVTTDARLKQLAMDKTTPRNRDEQEILGYRNVLRTIHENYQYISITPNYILQLHRDLLSLTSLTYGGKFKNSANQIVMVKPNGEKSILFQPLDSFETPAAVEKICDSYQRCLANESVDELILICCFILDFLCIHPFNDGNGRMSRLLTLLMLYRSGYEVGKYISIEKEIADTKANYYDVLRASDAGWHNEENDPIPFIKYMLGIILSCYREFESRIVISNESGIKSTSYDIVRLYVTNKIGAFTKQEALEACPSLGSSSVEAALKKLCEDGTIERIGAGRNTKYVRR